MWFLLLYLHISAIQGLNVTLSGSDSPCKGRLEVFKDEQWGLVCHFEWNSKNAEVVCKSLMCGDVVESGEQNTLYKNTPLPTNYSMNRVNCTSKETSLLNCSYLDDENCNNNGEGSFVAVECTGNVVLSLNLNGLRDTCAGVVEFSTESGTVGVCNSDWNENTANKICQELNCGTSHYIPKLQMFKGQLSKQNVLLKCYGNMQYSWQCMEESQCLELASVICTKHRRFRLQKGNNVCSGLVEMQNVTDKSWVPLQAKDLSPNLSAKVICTQLNCGTSGHFDNGTDSLRLTCSGSVKVLNFTSKCSGDVSVNVNGSKYSVCYNDAYETLGSVVCRELGCGKLLAVEKRPNFGNDLLSNFECLGDEMSLGHCLANHGIKKCQTATVICEGSLDVRLSNGLGRCSGRVELQWEGSWKSISSKDWTTDNSNVVCEHLKCGKSFSINKKLYVESKPEQMKPSWNFKCDSSSAKLHECLKQTNKQSASNHILDRSEPNVQIICQKEELMFFEGDSPCRGIVRIKPFDGDAKAQMLENKTEANKICHLMKCGDIVPFEKQHNSTYVNVTCSGSVSVALRNNLNERCWGRVEVCRREKSTKCGGVCSGTWEDDYSTKICDNLGCGYPIKSQLPKEESFKQSVNVFSVYCLKEVQNMSMCKFTDNIDPCDNIAVICSGSIKVKLEDPRDKCAGKVSLFHSGKWTPVCQESLTNSNLKHAICRELNCGQFHNADLTLPDKYTSNGISGIQCPGGAESVSKCNFAGISIKHCTAGYLKCTGWQRLYMYKKEGPCSGPVYSLSENKSQLVSGQGWGKEEGQKLCEYLQCGNYTSHITKPLPKGEEWWNKTYNCSGKENMWECERQDQAVELYEHLNITCDGNPDIMLSNYCTGKVLINKKHVCANHLDRQMASKLCESLRCGNAIHTWTSKVPDKTNCLHLSCTGQEMRLWQCGTTEDKCENSLSVACERSIKFGSTEKCGGKLAVKYTDQWEYVCGELSNTREICQKLNCSTPVSEKEIKGLHVTIKCPARHQHIDQCVRIKKETCRKPAEIKCEGYIEKEKPQVNSGLIVGLSLGMLGLLIMVFMWMNRKRLLLALRHYRNKNSKDIKTDRNEMNNMDTKDRDLSQGNASSLEYDNNADVDSAKNKTGEEEDDRSAGSSGTEYDDIEGQNSDISPHQTHADEDVPLLPKRPDNILDQDTYEVETEKQEDYDDVMPVENAGRAAQAQVDVDVDAGTDSEAGTGVNGDAVVVTTEVEVHAKQE